jgi:hypothetical protein
LKETWSENGKVRKERTRDQENRSKAQKYSIQEMNFDQTVQYDKKKTLCPIPTHMMTNYMSEQKEDKPLWKTEKPGHKVQQRVWRMERGGGDIEGIEEKKKSTVLEATRYIRSE